MATLLFGSTRSADETLPMPIHTPASRVPAGEAQVVGAPPSVAPRHETPPPRAASAPPLPPQLSMRRREWPALPAMMIGLLWSAAVWVGLAISMIALAYPMSWGARFWLLMLGSWLVAAGIAYALTSRPESA